MRTNIVHNKCVKKKPPKNQGQLHNVVHATKDNAYLQYKMKKV